MHILFSMMKMPMFYVVVVALFIVVGCVGGEPEPDYDSLIEAGKSSGVRSDTLFLGYYFGMTRDDFYEYSWDLNRQGIITGMTKVKYAFDDLPHKATKLFFPDFHDGKISKMPVTVSYDAWAPWNQDHSADSLMIDLVDHYSRELDTEFVNVYLPDQQSMGWLSVSGNRAIEIYKKSDMIMGVDFTDLSVEEE